jgi:hypothetical protein
MVNTLNSIDELHSKNAIARIRSYDDNELQILEEKALDPAEHKEDMLAIAKALPHTPKDRITQLIANYQAKIQFKMDAMNDGENVDIDALLQDVHILLMLAFGKDRANEKDMEEIANKTIVQLRDQIKGTFNTWGQLSFAIAGSSLMILGGCAGIGSLVGPVSKSLKVASSALPQIGQGLGGNGIGGILSEKNNASRNYLQLQLEIIKGKQGINRSDSQSAQQKEDQFLQMAARVREMVNQTKSKIASAA